MSSLPSQQGSSPLFSALADGLNFVQKVGYLFFQVMIEAFTFLCLFHQVFICFIRSHHRLYRAVPSVDQAMWVTTITVYASTTYIYGCSFPMTQIKCKYTYSCCVTLRVFRMVAHSTLASVKALIMLSWAARF